MLKFANYFYHGKNMNNLGDHVQIMTLDYLYGEMGVNREEIINIDLDSLGSYSGQPVILPVSMPLINYSEHGAAGMFSKNITPVFLGLTLVKDTLLPEEADFYKRYEPVGCRDERTFNTMVKYGVKAYLGGCLTAALPKRETGAEPQTKVFIIDPPKGIANYIPPEIAEDAVTGTHIFYGHMDNPTDAAKERYGQYIREARLIITSLLHGSVPCMAFGIPVVLVKDVVSYRFGWLEPLLKIHTPEDYAGIDWNPSPVDYEPHKKLVKNLFEKRVTGTGASAEIKRIHDFYMDRDRKEYVVDAFFRIKEFIDSTWTDKEKKYDYAVWGLTQMAEVTAGYISENYPNAKLAHVYDIKPGLTFKGIPAQPPENAVFYPNETVFVTTVSAAAPARKLFNDTNKPARLYKILEVEY